MYSHNSYKINDVCNVGYNPLLMLLQPLGITWTHISTTYMYPHQIYNKKLEI